jgi:hypothetical protein
MAQEPLRGFFFNTIHRHFLLPGATCTGEVYPADVTWVTNSYFQLFTTEYLERYAGATIVQLHNFANETLEQDGIGVVLSSGTEAPSDQLLTLYASLQAELVETKVALYPFDTDEFGATLNAQGRWMRENLRGSFLHLELSSDFLVQLVADKTTRNHWVGGLVAAFEAG